MPGRRFLAGLVSRRGTDDQPVPGPVSVQVKTILDNAGVLLRIAGVGLEDVFSSTRFDALICATLLV